VGLLGPMEENMAPLPPGAHMPSSFSVVGFHKSHHPVVVHDDHFFAAVRRRKKRGRRGRAAGKSNAEWRHRDAPGGGDRRRAEAVEGVTHATKHVISILYCLSCTCIFIRIKISFFFSLLKYSTATALKSWIDERRSFVLAGTVCPRLTTSAAARRAISVLESLDVTVLAAAVRGVGRRGRHRGGGEHGRGK
jgi:hypothetical protein